MSTPSTQQEGSGFDLGSFLAHQAKVGTADSSGEFSVAHEKALEKLAHFSLVGGYTWILKLMQCMALWRPKRITVTQTQEKTTFLFCPSHRYPTEQDVVEAFQSGIWHKDNPLAQLCLALRALVEQAGLAFVLSINGENVSSSPIYSGDDVARLSEKERLRWAHHTKRGVQLVVSHFKGNESWTGRLIPTFSQWERRDLRIASALEDNALFHSVPIWLDGRFLNSPTTHGEYGITTKFRTVALWGAKVPGLAPLDLPDSFEGKLFSVETTPSRAARPYQGKRDFDCWFILKSRAPNRLRPAALYLSKSKHEILWLQNGVVVERSVASGLSSITQATILLSAEGFGTDLSGLALTRSDQRLELQAQALERVSEEITTLCRDTRFLEAEDADARSFSEEKFPALPQSRLKDDVLTSLGFGLLGGLSFIGGPSLAVAGVSAVAAAVVSFAARKHRNSETTQATLKERWVQQVRQDLEKLTALNQLAFKVVSGEGGGRRAEELFRPKNVSEAS
ncbi:MAG: hypothetical protein WC314_12975 [Vulcanimicrobiota bacterium]